MLYFHNPFTSTYQNIPIRHAPLGPFDLPLGTSNPHHQLASQDWVADPLIPSDVLLRICRRIQITFRRCRCRWCRWGIGNKLHGGIVTETTTKNSGGFFLVLFSPTFGDWHFLVFFWIAGKILWKIFWGIVFFSAHNLGPPLSDFVVATLSTTWLIYCDFVCNLSVPKRPKLRFMFCCWHNIIAWLC